MIVKSYLTEPRSFGKGLSYLALNIDPGNILERLLNEKNIALNRQLFKADLKEQANAKLQVESINAFLKTFHLLKNAYTLFQDDDLKVLNRKQSQAFYILMNKACEIFFENEEQGFKYILETYKMFASKSSYIALNYFLFSLSTHYPFLNSCNESLVSVMERTISETLADFFNQIKPIFSVNTDLINRNYYKFETDHIHHVAHCNLELIVRSMGLSLTDLETQNITDFSDLLADNIKFFINSGKNKIHLINFFHDFKSSLSTTENAKIHKEKFVKELTPHQQAKIFNDTTEKLKRIENFSFEKVLEFLNIHDCLEGDDFFSPLP